MKCTALSRIVYGDSHWQFASCHIQLGKSYLDLKGIYVWNFNSKDVLCWSCKRRRKLLSSHVTGYGTHLSHLPDLPEQALVHAVKGRGILLLPGSHVTSHDPPPEAVHHLAVAHCVVGRVLTMQGKYPHKMLNVL